MVDRRRKSWRCYLCNMAPRFALLVGVVLGMMIERLELHELAVSYGQNYVAFNRAARLGEKSDETGAAPLTKLQTSAANNGQPFVVSIADPENITSPLKSRVNLFQKEGDVKVGDFVHVVIESRDSNGRPRNVGGDFFFAVMTDSLSRQSTAGRVVDHRNGSYSVYFYAGWVGTAYISLTLAHPREAVDWIDNVYRSSERNVDWTAYYEDAVSGVTEQSTCYLLRNNKRSDKCEYRNEKAMGKTVYVCDRPATLPCEKLKTVTCAIESLANHVERKLSCEQRFLFESPYLMTSLKGSPFWIETKESDNDVIDIRSTLPECGPDLPIPISDGFWETYNTWTSLACRTRHWTGEAMKRCLAGKTVYMIGDSTLRQVYESLTLVIGQKMDFDIIRQYWSDPKLKTTLIFEFHAVIVGTYMLDFWGQKFETDILDGFTHCNYVVVISLTHHLVTWTVESYTERLLRLRAAILRLKTRCPDVVIVVKSSHPRDHAFPGSHIHSADWTLFDMNRILRETLGGIGVRFMDVWDMALSFWGPNSIHLPRKVVRQQVDLLLSYICAA